MAAHPEPFYLSVGPGPLGQRFALHHLPQQGAPRGLVVYVHPFAEEMNKSRRMAALQSRALAEAGFAVLQMDLLGCGDSGGDFGDASWKRWVDDVVQASQWLQQRHGQPGASDAVPLTLWGLRAGCLLAAQAATRLAQGCHFLFWQPVMNGKTALQQFLRLKIAGEMLGGHAKGAMAALQQQLAGGQTVEIAGYRLAASLAAGLEGCTLRPPPLPGRVDWLELTASPEQGLSPAASTAARLWQQAGARVRTQAVAGPAFWQTTEIEESPALLAATLQAMLAPQQGCEEEQLESHAPRDAMLSKARG